MKKCLLSFFAASALLFAATSCSEDDELLSGGSGSSEKVSFQVEMDGTGPTSRALGDGTGADKLYYEVWDMNTNTNVYDTQVNIIDLGDGKRGATLSLELVKGVPYDILFWAHNDANSAFDASELTAVTMKTAALKANMEAYDAFTAALNGYKVQSGSKTVVSLKRPFAQVNVGTTKTDWGKAEKLQVVIDQSLVTVKGVKTVYNVATGVATEEKPLTYALNALVDNTNTFKVTKDGVETEYYYLGMNYMLADVEKGIKDMEIELHDGEHLINTIKVANLPIQRNYRTNVIGNLLTSDEGFEVVIDPNFKDTHVVTVWDGGIKEPSTDADGAYLITEAAELAWIAEQVNHQGKTFADATVKLVNDIDLQNHGWMPIGHGGNAYNVNFQGTFDGQGNTISNLNVTNEEKAGLFGQMVKGTVKNVNIKNVTISTNHYAGAIVAWAEQGGGDIVIENCHVDGGTITVTPDFNSGIYDNGDKAGGLVGFLWAGTIKDSSVKNLAIAAYRDLGGIVGYASKATVTGNEVENVSIAVDQSANPYKDAPKDANAGEIIGRTGDSNTTTPENTATNVTIASKISSTDVSLATEPEYDKTTQTVTADNAQELLWFLHKVNGTLPAETAGRAASSDLSQVPNDFTGHTFNLTCNVDLGGIEWTPIGTNENHFKGSFEGNNNTISNFKITKKNSDGNQAALFGTISGTTSFKNLKLENIEIVYPSGSGDFYAAALVGTYYGNVTVENVTVTGANISGNNKVAGLMAHDGVCSSLNITNCHVLNSTIASANKEDGGNVGGLLGLFQGVGKKDGTSAPYGTHVISKSSVKNCVINGINSSNNGKRANSEFIGGINSKAGQVLEITGCTIENNTFTDVQSDGSKVTYASPYAPYERYIGGAREEMLAGTVIVNGYQFIADGCWSNDKGIYYISNANGLATLNTMFANKTVGNGVVVNLTDDINFTGKTWTPVDSHADSPKAVLKELNGNGHTISNLTINGQAMFTRFAGNQELVTIKDVTFDNATVNSTAINTSILTVQSYENVLLDNVDVKNSSITGGYKVAPLIATVYNESSSTVTATLKGCDVENVTVKATSYDFCTTGMVAFVNAGNNDKIEFENCTVKDVKLIAPEDSYKAHAAIYTTGSGSLYNEAEGVTVTNVTFEALK